MPAGTQLLLHVFQYLAEDLIQRPYGGYFQPLIGRVDIVGHAAQIDHVELTAALVRLGLENAALDTGVYLGDLRVVAGDPAEDGDGLFLLDTEPIPPRQVLLILRRDGQSSVLSRRFVELLQTAGE